MNVGLTTADLGDRVCQAAGASVAASWLLFLALLITAVVGAEAGPEGVLGLACSCSGLALRRLRTRGQSPRPVLLP
jgi:hypothetical protein